MNQRATWWSQPDPQEGASRSAPGELSRLLRLTSEPPRRIDLAAPRAVPPRALLTASVMPTRRLAAGTRLGRGGSVDLTARPRRQRIATRHAPLDQPGQAADQRMVGAGAADQWIPLWWRLASLLQPPVELLVTEEGPVEWPA